MPSTPLSILDLSPVPAGGTVTDALRNTVDLARRAEQSGCHRYWLAEHHLAAGVASSAPAVLIGQVAAATSAIRVGSGAVQVGHRTALSVVEEFGTLAALHPGRIDLGLGRSGQRRVEAAREIAAPTPPPVQARVVDGLLIPPPFSYAQVLASPRFALSSALLHQPGAQPPPFAEQVADVLALLRGDYTDADGLDAHAVPGEATDLQVWLLGSSGGESAHLAGGVGPALRCQLPRQPVLGARCRDRLPGRVPALGGTGPAVRGGLRGRRRRRHRHRRDGTPARRAVRGLGTQHPQR
ncbi:LLM class flavin-dependent oxidoreductase [Micromonospora sp. NPDC049114]|uniref:LLM class flavin-dependent oxidoreductase n=1 Tax=unclassified Micromonospora TaxID=2617518 RepID=UPI0033D33153